MTIHDGADPLRVVLLGAGRMARQHAAAIERLPGATVVGVGDPSREALAAMAAVVPHAVLDRDPGRLLAATDAHVAHVCTPPASHPNGARAALQAGLHVYVEKPFALDAEEAGDILALADRLGLRVCAGHQLLFERPSLEARKLLPAAGSVVHMESYFAFRQVRSGRDGHPALSAEDQLIDILPHPIYLLLSYFEQARPGAPVDVEHINIGRGGTVHGLLRCDDLTGTLVVTLSGRPVESYVRLVGTNGSIHADYVRGTVQRAIGPGASGIDKALAPYRLARQLLGGTTAALGRRVLKRQKSYPGLVEALGAFYTAIRGAGPDPMTPRSIHETVRVCQRITEELALYKRPVTIPSVDADLPSPRVVVTGGTGFLGREVLRELRAQGIVVRSVARRAPASWDRLPGVDYHEADLSDGLETGVLQGVESVIHCAAETSGGWDAHARNSTGATENLLIAAASAGVRHVVYISSLAVLEGRGPLSEESPLQLGKTAGPYVWGKAQAEKRARELGEELGVRLTILRPGALVDWRRLDPPGKLGRRLGNLFVAVGGRRDTLGIVDVADVARVAIRAALQGDGSPAILNVIDPDLPTKADLVSHLRKANPDLRVVWVPRAVLWPFSGLAMVLQKLLRPGRPAVSVAHVFAGRTFDATAMRRLQEHLGETTGPNGSGPGAQRHVMSPAGSE
jgi:predicted dehydrogenase/nucleoside-diphosphate-sugar epimerase